VRTGNEILVNGRTYGIKGTSTTLYPITGPGFVQLDRASYQALKIYISDGEKAAQNEISRNPYLRSNADLATVQSLYKLYLQYKSGAP